MQTQHEVYRDQLEEILDHCALDTLIYMLSEVCALKAEHLESNWQDAKSAKLWSRAGRYLDSASQNVAVSQVSIHAERS